MLVYIKQGRLDLYPQKKVQSGNRTKQIDDSHGVNKLPTKEERKPIKKNEEIESYFDRSPQRYRYERNKVHD